MKNTIIINQDKTLTVMGSLAHSLYFGAKKELETIINGIETSKNVAWVFDSNKTLRAAQYSIDGAKRFMNDERVLVYREQ